MENDGIKSVLKETFEGPEGNTSWFTESEPGSGLFGTIQSLTAEEVSVSVRGVTIAAHTDHTRYHMWANNQLLKSEAQNFNWDKSWEIRSVTEDEWQQIQRELQHEYSVMMEQISSEQDFHPASANIFLGALAHAAYHLGAIRQMVKAVR